MKDLSPVDKVRHAEEPEMPRLKRGSLRIPSGTRGDATKRLAGEKLLECAQNLTPELAALNRAARRYNKLLSRDVSAAEIAVLAIPATALTGKPGDPVQLRDQTRQDAQRG